jgi:hypothetical protein
MSAAKVVETMAGIEVGSAGAGVVGAAGADGAGGGVGSGDAVT